MFAARNQLITLEYNRAGDLFEFPVGPTRVGTWESAEDEIKLHSQKSALRFTRGIELDRNWRKWIAFMMQFRALSSPALFHWTVFQTEFLTYTSRINVSVSSIITDHLLLLIISSIMRWSVEMKIRLPRNVYFLNLCFALGENALHYFNARWILFLQQIRFPHFTPLNRWAKILKMYEIIGNKAAICKYKCNRPRCNYKFKNIR